MSFAVLGIDHVVFRLRDLARREPFGAAAIRAPRGAFGVPCTEPSSKSGAEGTGLPLSATGPEGNTIELKGPPISDPEDFLPLR